jgi:hypothetical protein
VLVARLVLNNISVSYNLVVVALVCTPSVLN